MFANGVGMDAILDQTNVAIIGNGASITDSTGNCISGGYGPTNVMTLAIDGMHLGDIAAFLGVPPLAPSSVMDDQWRGHGGVRLA